MAQGSNGMPEGVRAFLAERRFASLATVNPDGTPQQTVMWYLLDGDEILMNTAVGRIKHRNLKDNPEISICVEDGYRYVAVSGVAGLDEDQERAHADVLRLAVHYHGQEDGQEQYERTFRGAERVSIRMTVDRVVHNGFE